MTVSELAVTLKREKLPGFEDGLDSDALYQGSASTFPNGCHICEVEVDPDTGKVNVVAYRVLDDFGRIINPMLVAGQVHGGVAQGLGQALLENCVYDAETGQIVTASFTEALDPFLRAEGLDSSDPVDVMKFIEMTFHQPADLGRAGLPEEVASITVYLGSQRNGYVTGANVNVDGGSDFV